jgi:hypothetical protein
MAHCYEDTEPAIDFLERRWFASLRAIKDLEAECIARLSALRQAEEAWQCANSQLAHLQNLRDGLEQELRALDGRVAPFLEAQRLAILSAA